MDSVLLVMSLFAVSGAIGILITWAVTSLIFACVLRRRTSF